METQAVEIKTPKKKARGETEAKPKEVETKGSFMKGLLASHPAGMTWQQIRQALIQKFGSAPKKRQSLYAILKDTPFEKKVGEKREVTYVLKAA
jgi:hypothetical protein